ncbi:hypothetical protein L6R29_21715 [Myxococcota bacterium]|nr:hypothetical protein [Myxococcota bacterium]
MPRHRCHAKKQHHALSSLRTKQPESTQAQRFPVPAQSAKIAAEPSPSQRIQGLRQTVADHTLHLGTHARPNPHKQKRSRHASREAVFAMLRQSSLHDTSEDVRETAISLIGRHFSQDREIIPLLFSALTINRHTPRNHPIYRLLEDALTATSAQGPAMRREALLQTHLLAKQPPWHITQIDLQPAATLQAEEALDALERDIPTAWLWRILEDGLCAPTENTLAHAIRLLCAAMSRSSAWLDLDAVQQHIQRLTAPLREPYALPITHSWQEHRAHQHRYLCALLSLVLLPTSYTTPFVGALQAISRYNHNTAERPFYLYEHERIQFFAMLCLLRLPEQIGFVETSVVQSLRTIGQGASQTRHTHNVLQLISHLPPEHPDIARWLLAHLTHPYGTFALPSLPLLARYPTDTLQRLTAPLQQHESKRLETLLPHIFSQDTTDTGSTAFRLLCCLPTHQNIESCLSLLSNAGISHAPAILHHLCHTPPVPLQTIYLFERWRSACLFSLQRNPPTHLRARALLVQLGGLIRQHQRQQNLTTHQLLPWQRDLEEVLLT